VSFSVLLSILHENLFQLHKIQTNGPPSKFPGYTTGPEPPTDYSLEKTLIWCSARE